MCFERMQGAAQEKGEQPFTLLSEPRKGRDSGESQPAGPAITFHSILIIPLTGRLCFGFSFCYIPTICKIAPSISSHPQSLKKDWRFTVPIIDFDKEPGWNSDDLLHALNLLEIQK